MELTHQVELLDILGEFLAVERERDVALGPVLVEVLVRDVGQLVDEGADLVELARLDLAVMILLGQHRAGQWGGFGGIVSR